MTTTPQAHAVQNRSRLDPEPIARRDLLGLAAMWSALATLFAAAVGSARLPKAAVMASPSKKFSVRIPETLAPGEPFIPPGRSVALFKDAEGMYAVSLVCTHLGCIVKQRPGGFDCPCHGSKFSSDGKVERGPAPKALPWLAVSPGPGGAVLVDEGTNVKPGTRVQV